MWTQDVDYETEQDEADTEQSESRLLHLLCSGTLPPPLHPHSQVHRSVKLLCEPDDEPPEEDQGCGCDAGRDITNINKQLMKNMSKIELAEKSNMFKSTEMRIRVLENTERDLNKCLEERNQLRTETDDTDHDDDDDTVRQLREQMRVANATMRTLYITISRLREQIAAYSEYDRREAEKQYSGDDKHKNITNIATSDGKNTTKNVETVKLEKNTAKDNL